MTAISTVRILLQAFASISNSTVIAILSERGELLEASAGFLQLLPEDRRSAAHLDVSRYFIQPGYARILQNLDGSEQIVSSLFTIGDRSGMTQTVTGAACRADDEIFFLAEQDVEDLTNISKAFLKQVMDLSDAQRNVIADLRKMKHAEAISHQEALTDPLTRLGNRRRLEDGLLAEIARARRQGGQLGIVMADLDHFKRVNDQYGHGVGDVVLKSFAELIRNSIRPFDLATRFGGEEFVVLMPGASLEDAESCAERIRVSIENHDFAGIDLPVTSSFGVTSLQETDTSNTLLFRVDAALYEAKETGRNRVVCSS